MKSPIGVIALLLIRILDRLYPHGLYMKEPPYTEDGLIDVAAYDIPELEVEQDVVDELDEYVKAFREAQRGLNNKVIQLMKDGRIPPMRHGLLCKIDKASPVGCFPGGWTFV